jgi:hypothetical protein
MRRALIVSGVLASLLAGGALAAQPESPAPKPGDDPAAACAAMMSAEGVTARGQTEMKRSMESGQMMQAMTGMMAMARQMGGGDPMKRMVRMMEMMGSMGGMMGPSAPQGHPAPQDKPAR